MTSFVSGHVFRDAVTKTNVAPNQICRGDCVSRMRGFNFDNILYQLLLGLLVVVKRMRTARRDVHRIKVKNFAVPDLNLKSKPVSAEHAS